MTSISSESKDTQPFYSNNYPDLSLIFPIIEFQLEQRTGCISMHALADTGCTGGLVLTKKQVDLLEVDLSNWEKSNDYPLPVEVADGRIVGCDIYENVTLVVNGKPKKIDLSVIGEESLPVSEEPEKTKTKEEIELEDWFSQTVIIGHGYLGHYDAIFSGTQRKLLLLP